MNTVNLQITLPDDVYHAIEKQNSGNNLNDFVLDAIKQKILKKKDTINLFLKEGYLASAQEDSQMLNEFAVSDFEHWD